ncbi:MAG: hypothetical protein AMJ92_10360 [candidate division Zixibacteria bacterium SM23_81]|nr:MAG: hypothetical protein AMJ92_10360 [candidate division Zixibacteria bacterium SM23_81]
MRRAKPIINIKPKNMFVKKKIMIIDNLFMIIKISRIRADLAGMNRRIAWAQRLTATLLFLWCWLKRGRVAGGDEEEPQAGWLPCHRIPTAKILNAHRDRKPRAEFRHKKRERPAAPLRVIGSFLMQKGA